MWNKTSPPVNTLFGVSITSLPFGCNRNSGFNYKALCSRDSLGHRTHACSSLHAPRSKSEQHHAVLSGSHKSCRFRLCQAVRGTVADPERRSGRKEHQRIQDTQRRVGIIVHVLWHTPLHGPRDGVEARPYLVRGLVVRNRVDVLKLYNTVFSSS